MAHTNQTEHYTLPQFIGSDIPSWLVDVNQAYTAIDSAIYAAKNTADVASNTAGSANTLAQNAKQAAEAATATANSAKAIAEGNTAQIADVSKKAGNWILGQVIAIGTSTLTVTNANIHPSSIIDVYYSQESMATGAEAGITYEVAEGSITFNLASSAAENITVSLHVVNP